MNIVIKLYDESKKNLLTPILLFSECSATELQEELFVLFQSTEHTLHMMNGKMTRCLHLKSMFTS